MFWYNLLEVGPLNTMSSKIFKKIQKAVRNISSFSIKSSWWTDFSSWEDLEALLRTGTKLSIHKVVANLKREFSYLELVDTFIEAIDENGNIIVQVDEDSEDVLQGFAITAKRKRLRRLSDVAAYNLAQYLRTEKDVEDLELPNNLKNLVKKFLITYSEDYNCIQQ